MTDKLISIEVASKALGIDMNSALAEFSALRARLFVSAEDYSALALKRVEDLSKPVAVKAPDIPKPDGKAPACNSRGTEPAGGHCTVVTDIAKKLGIGMSALRNHIYRRKYTTYSRRPDVTTFGGCSHISVVSDATAAKIISYYTNKNSK